jgi:predicted metal-dependent enzyme (double-stranded beta helix superfamily)
VCLDPAAVGYYRAPLIRVCDVLDHRDLEPLEHDEWLLDSPLIHRFIRDVRVAMERSASAEEACRVVEPSFKELLTSPGWLPARFQVDAPQSGMGAGIGQWLLFRAADRSLCLFSLVVPAGAMTPVHDHLAWGLVGLYKGSQDEEFYDPRDGRLELVRQRPLEPGDYYTLLPPRDDVHRVRTTSEVTSVSIHLLANDTGCVLRHTFDEQTGEARPFRSGYVNAECPGGTSLS